jgi:hypothetical protein
MALWGISTTTETAANNYAIPKYQHSVDRNRSPWNTFADVRGWIQRWYGTTENSGLSTSYYDEVLVPVVGLNTGTDAAGDPGENNTGIGSATPVAVFFEDPNKASPISVGGGATTGVTTGRTAYVHVVWNENVYAGAGATVRVRTFDANGANESTAIVAYASSVAPGAEIPVYTNEDGYRIVSNYNGQISNRVAFGFTSPSSVLTANVNFLTTATSSGQTVAIGGTVIFVDSIENVSAGSSLTITGKLTNVPVVSIGDTFVRIGTGSTIGSTIGPGLAATFSTRTNKTKLVLDLTAGVVGTITDFSGGGAVNKVLTGLLYNVGGAGTTGSVGLGTDILDVTP